MNKKILLGSIMMPIIITTPVIITAVSCGKNDNEYVKNKKYLLGLIEEVKNQFKEIINEIPKEKFEKDISTPYFLNMSNNETKTFKLKDLLNDEVVEIIIFNRFKEYIKNIYELDNDNKQIYSKVLEIKKQIFYEKVSFIFYFETFVKTLFLKK